MFNIEKINQEYLEKKANEKIDEAILEDAGRDAVENFSEVLPSLEKDIEGNEKLEELFSEHLSKTRESLEDERKKQELIENLGYFSNELKTLSKEELEKLIPVALSTTNLGVAILGLLKEKGE